jgi:uncharacterized protein (TIGR00251 family)
MIRYTESEGALTFDVRVAPRASRSELAGEHGGALKVRVAAPPVEGAANEELTRFLSKTFGVAARDVEVISGHASKNKRVSVQGAKASDLLRLLGKG